MTASWWCGSVHGVRVGLHWSVLLPVLLVSDALAQTALPAAAPGRSAGAYWLAGLVGSLLLLAGILLHELSHVRTAQRCGLPVSSVVLWGLGGVSQLEQDPADAETELRVALAGPLASFAVAAALGLTSAFFAAAGGGELAVATLSWAAGTNVLLAVFNLLPGTPLDGGRVLRALLWRRSGDPVSASAAAGRAGQRVGAGLAGLGLAELAITGSLGGLWLVVLGWFIASSAMAEARYRVAVAALGDLRVGAVMVSHPTCAPGDWTLARFVEHRARHSPHSSYPVIDRVGRPVGLLRWTQALHSPQDPRQHQLVAEDCVPLDRCVVLDESARVADALPRVARLRPPDSAIVTCDGVVCGVLSPRDLTRRMQIAGVLGNGTASADLGRRPGA